jgi:hypothetical protein
MTTHEELLACFRSEQMTAAQIQQHIRDDPAFAEYVKETLTNG